MRKTVLLYLLSTLSLNLFLTKTLNAQQIQVSETQFKELKEHFDRLNGPDYQLLNGRQYHPLNSGSTHPYFDTDQYRPGSLVLNGEAYDNVKINYDIVDQQLILQYPGNSGQDLKVILNRDMIDRFQIDGLSFRNLSYPEGGSSFFQEVSSGDISCFLRWEKALYHSTVSGITNYSYSKQSREVYLQKEDRLYVVRNRSSFTSIFDEALQKEINAFLRREKINFRDASGEKLAELMKFCVGLIHKD